MFAADGDSECCADGAEAAGTPVEPSLRTASSFIRRLLGNMSCVTLRSTMNFRTLVNFYVESLSSALKLAMTDATQVAAKA